MARSKTPLALAMALLDTITTSKGLRDVTVTLVGLSFIWWAFPEGHIRTEGRHHWYSRRAGHSLHPQLTRCPCSGKRRARMLAISSSSRQERPMPGGL